MPGGIIISTPNDGEYKTQINKAADGQIVAIRIEL